MGRRLLMQESADTAFGEQTEEVDDEIADAIGASGSGTEGQSLGNRLTQSLPTLRKPPPLPASVGLQPINVYPNRFDYVSRNTRLFQLNHPWQLFEEEKAAKKTYLPKEKERLRALKRKEEEKQI